MMSAALRKDPFEFPVDLSLESSVLRLAEAIDRCGSKGVVFGASVGIDSFVMASLCLRARGKTPKWQVVALQMNDARIRRESYNTELFNHRP
jgi:NH3-dependent NAD+ synthetase